VVGYVVAEDCTRLDIRICFWWHYLSNPRKQGINQEEAAGRCGLRQTYYGGSERGIRDFS
jgi:hypothetical protein